MVYCDFVLVIKLVLLLLFVMMFVVVVFMVTMVTFWCPQSLWLCVRVVWPNGGVSVMWFVWFLMLFLWLLLLLFVVVAKVFIMVNYCDLWWLWPVAMVVIVW